MDTEVTRRTAKHRDESNKVKIETKKDSGKSCFTVRNILMTEKLKDKLKHIMRTCKIVNCVDKESSSGAQMSSRRRSSRTALAGLHRTCRVERRNTNVEELTKNNTADLFTEH